MIDNYSYTAFAVGRRVQRGATTLAYWGIFSVACNAARKYRAR